MAPARRRDPRRRFLTIATICLALAVLFCGLGWWFVGRHAVSYSEAVSAFDERVASEFPAGSRWTFRTAQPGEPAALLLGLPQGPDTSEVAALQDRLWRAYAEVFAEGGLGIDRVGIGRAAGRALDDEEGPEHFGHVTGWEPHATDVAHVAERTGSERPPLHPIVQIMGEEFRVPERGTSAD